MEKPKDGSIAVHVSIVFPALNLRLSFNHWEFWTTYSLIIILLSEAYSEHT